MPRSNPLPPPAPLPPAGPARLSRRALLPTLAAAAAPPPGPTRRISAWTSPPTSTIPGLTAKIEGRQAPILRLLPPSSDLLLLLVLDLTGDLTLADAARQAAIAELANLPPSAWAAILRSQDGLRVLLDPTSDRAATSSALLNAPVSGRAGLLESIEPAARLATSLLHKSPIRTALLYLTDSNIYNYREDYTNPVINMSDSRDLSRRFPDALIREKSSKIASALAQTDAPIFLVHLAFLRDRLNEAYQTGLQQMADSTGGAAFFARNLGEIPTLVAQAFNRISSMWAIDLQIPPGSPKNLTVQLSSSSSSANLQYRTRLVLGPREKE